MTASLIAELLSIDFSKLDSASEMLCKYYSYSHYYARGFDAVKSSASLRLGALASLRDTK